MLKRVLSIAVVISLSLVATNVLAAEAVKVKYVATAYVDAANKALHFPDGITCDDTSFFVVGDTGNGRLVKYTFANSAVTGGEEIKVPELAAPIRLHLNSKGEILALDGKQLRIARIGKDGVFKGYLTPSQLTSPETFIARSFAVDGSDNVYVLDIFGNRVFVTDPAGSVIRQIKLPNTTGVFSDIAVDQRGTIFVIDSVNVVIHGAARDATAFSPLGVSFKEYMTLPTSIVSDSVGNIYVSDQDGSGIAVVGQDGSFLSRQLGYGWKDGQLRYPSQLCINKKGELFVADRNNDRVQIFTVLK